MAIFAVSHVTLKAKFSANKFFIWIKLILNFSYSHWVIQTDWRKTFFFCFSESLKSRTSNAKVKWDWLMYVNVINTKRPAGRVIEIVKLVFDEWSTKSCWFVKFRKKTEIIIDFKTVSPILSCDDLDLDTFSGSIQVQHTSLIDKAFWSTYTFSKF